MVRAGNTVFPACMECFYDDLAVYGNVVEAAEEAVDAVALAERISVAEAQSSSTSQGD
jgi:hypothetical protein